MSAERTGVTRRRPPAVIGAEHEVRPSKRRKAKRPTIAEQATAQRRPTALKLTDVAITIAGHDINGHLGRMLDSCLALALAGKSASLAAGGLTATVKVTR